MELHPPPLATPPPGFSVREVVHYDPGLIPFLNELDLLTYAEPTFSRFSLGAFLRHGRVYIARVDDVLVGSCHCLRDFSQPDEVVIFNMALRPGWRGNGMGRHFLERVLDMLRAHGVRAVSLQVAENNLPAQRLYKDKFGFQEVEVHCDEYCNGQDYRQMRLFLTPD
ncbi:MAG TPA: GNAT family N-acetyltransferase [Myxococcota bacterium]|nr:GNAT family N-acetyltransferase [Myxococcota bacterium]